ncbi:MAG TPA: efflux RND transporter periplasmic adaptor subunit [Myxococcota bacterium]|jgi:HlyD family secretion protein|nr:efflux RND transporter periplasmic adaptor subunit [Myxococcota bacterium]
MRRPQPLRGIALAACLASLSCSRGDATPAGPLASVERGRLERIVVATGTVEAENEVEVRSRIPGIVETIHVVAGDRVKAGQPLIELEKELLDAQLDEARAGLREAEVEDRYATIALGRVSRLEKSDATSEHALDEARDRAEKASATLAKARASVTSLEVQRRYATITASRDGTVLDVDVEVGTAVAPVGSVTGGTLLATVADAEHVHLKGLVDENEIGRIAVGQAARVRTEAFPDRRFPGRLRKITPLGKRVQNVTYFEVEVEITGEDATLLRPRMSGDADIIAEVVEGALFVPETALRYATDGTHVQRIAAGSPAGIEEVPVETGIVDGAKVEVRKGLSEGDRVVLQ